ncbi:MAG: BRO family protein [Eubacteriales bacterium]
MNEIMTIKNIRAYEKDGMAYLNAEDVARGLGFTTVATSGNEAVRWKRVNGYLKDFNFNKEVTKEDFIPETIFYRLCMKAKNETAEKFQIFISEEVMPSIRTTGYYQAKPPMPKKPKNQTVPSIKMHQGEQVVTLRDIEAIIGVDRSVLRWCVRGEGSIFEEEKDYYFIKSGNLHNFKRDNKETRATVNSLILITKSGCEKFWTFYDMKEVVKMFEQIQEVKQAPTQETEVEIDRIAVQEKIKEIRRAMTALDYKLEAETDFWDIEHVRRYQWFVENNAMDIGRLCIELGRKLHTR